MSRQKKREQRYAVAVTLDGATYELLRLAAEEDYNSPEYELMIAIRKGLELLTGCELKEE